MRYLYGFAAAALAAFSLTCLGQNVVSTDDHYAWSGRLAPGKLLEIKDVNGVIEATGIAGDTIEIAATKTGRDRDQVRIEQVETSEGMTFCAVYPGNSCREGDHGSNGTHNVKAGVDFVVRIPRNLRFSGFNVNGSVRAEGLGESADARSVNGNVEVSTSSWARGSSVNGSVRLTMGRADWPDRLKISSVNGSIELELPSDLNSTVNFKTVNGRIDSEFPLTIQGGFLGRHVSGTVGSGGSRELEVSTVNGSIHLRKESL
ncbi:MAG: DUF4097 family beta strand repeat protein [Acidobacteria bacterium]|nr:DUF4097 family beta strand repeat protein [Acidobacteriota bacterium]